MKIEVVDAGASPPVARTLIVPEGARVSEALACWGRQAPGREWGFGVFGREVDADYVLQEGDRLELCPPLAMSPPEARRRRAAGKPKS